MEEEEFVEEEVENKGEFWKKEEDVEENEEENAECVKMTKNQQSLM